MARKKKKRQKKTWTEQFAYEACGLLLVGLAVLAIADMGVIGRLIADFFKFFAGEWYMLFLLGLLFLALYFIWKRDKPDFFTRRLVGIYLFVFSLLLFSHVRLFQILSGPSGFNDPSVIRQTWQLFWNAQMHNEASSDLGGGMLGAVAFAFSYVLFSAAGTKFIAVVLMLIAMILITGKSFGETTGKVFSRLATGFGKQYESLKSDLRDWKEERGQKKREKRSKIKQREAKSKENKQHPIENQDGFEPIIHDFSEHHEPKSDSKKPLAESEGPRVTIRAEKSETFSEPAVENKDYRLPPLELLSPPNPNHQNEERHYISQNARKLEKTFESFGVRAKVRKVHLGPAVTKYEVYPDVGVKVSKIVNLHDDLALALAAREIRIEAPIPGKSAVGIEVPNQHVAMVTLREVLESNVAREEMSKVAIGLGRDISGAPVVADLAKMPHLLIAGATGSGKSVCINGIVTSILIRARPHEVKMMMIDPKMVELNVYNGIPHLLTPVVTDPKKAAQALKKVVNEMERRYELFSESGTRNIEGYNEWLNRKKKGGQEAPLPYIVVIVDELADLMMVASRDVEDAITRLAQMARAAGIHLIIATQRPSVDVITGVIKANIPSRIAFSVSSQTDSRTILDMGGADKLLGKGDMLFLPQGASKPTRIQGAFLSDGEVEAITKHVIAEQKAQYEEEMMPKEEKEDEIEVDDELFEDAVKLVMEMNTASVSMLQRRFRIGYTRAARLIDAMEARGIVGPYEGSKPREVLANQYHDEASAK